MAYCTEHLTKEDAQSSLRAIVDMVLWLTVFTAITVVLTMAHSWWGVLSFILLAMTAGAVDQQYCLVRDYIKKK